MSVKLIPVTVITNIMLFTFILFVYFQVSKVQEVEVFMECLRWVIKSM